MAKRNTIQRSLVAEAVKKLKNHPTADEVYNEIIKEYPNISKGTVYSNLNALCKMGVIAKRGIPEGADHFDHISDKHYHSKCEACGHVFDVEMAYMTDLEKMIRDKHGFEFIGHDIIFKCLCSNCKNLKNNDVSE